MNSAHNLKQWQFKPGQSGNPKGRPVLPPELRAIKILTPLELSAYVSKYAKMPAIEMKEAVLNPTLPMIELVIANIFMRAVEQGDYQRLAFLLDRAVGRPKEIITEPDKFESMTNDDLINYIRENIPQLAAKSG